MSECRVTGACLPHTQYPQTYHTCLETLVCSITLYEQQGHPILRSQGPSFADQAALQLSHLDQSHILPVYNARRRGVKSLHPTHIAIFNAPIVVRSMPVAALHNSFGEGPTYRETSPAYLVPSTGAITHASAHLSRLWNIRDARYNFSESFMWAVHFGAVAHAPQDCPSPRPVKLRVGLDCDTCCSEEGFVERTFCGSQLFVQSQRIAPSTSDGGPPNPDR